MKLALLYTLFCLLVHSAEARDTKSELSNLQNFDLQSGFSYNYYSISSEGQARYDGNEFDTTLKYKGGVKDSLRDPKSEILNQASSLFSKHNKNSKNSYKLSATQNSNSNRTATTSGSPSAQTPIPSSDHSQLKHNCEKLYKEVKEKQIQLIGEPTMISNCPHNCNNVGLCQKIFIETTSESKSQEPYEPHYSCACAENFKGTYCQECAYGFYGHDCYPCSHESINAACQVGGLCEDSSPGSHTQHEQEEALTFGFIILVLIALCCTILLYLYHKYKNLHLFPESCAAVVFGIVAGLFIKYYYQNNNLMKILSFEPHTFFLFLLPPIMFEAGFSLKANIFFRSFLTISAYAILATFLASVIFSLIFYFGTSLTVYPFMFIESFQFGCFISAIDPVATISIFKSLRVSEKLYMIVFGESALNDAVSIALAQSAEKVGGVIEDLVVVDYFGVVGEATAHFFIYFFGSMFTGALSGILVSYIFAKFDFHLVPWIEIGLFFILSYFPYVLSEGIGLSGILAILIAAIFMRNYAFHSLSPVGQVTVESMVEMACNISENFVFAYMGLSVPILLNNIKFELIGIGVVSLLTSRTISVIATSYLVNIFRKDKIPISYQAIMSFSGLRGAVAFYLALNVSSNDKELIIMTTIALIIITIVGLGSTTTCLLKALARYFPEDGIFHNEETEDLLPRRDRGVSDLSDSLYEKNFDSGPISRGRGVSQDHSIGVITRLEKFDMDYGRKFLRKDGWEDFLDDEADNKYGVEIQNSPAKGKYYDNLSNYQMSVRKYLEESVVNLPYEDRKSVRLSVMSQRDDPSRATYLHPNRKRIGSNTREEYERQMQFSKREKPTTKSMRGEQMSIMSEPRGKPQGLIKGLSPPTQKAETDKRLNIPPMNINIGTLDDISSKGSQGYSKSDNEAIKKQTEDNTKRNKAFSFEKEENKVPLDSNDELVSKKRQSKVKFHDEVHTAEPALKPEDQSKIEPSADNTPDPESNQDKSKNEEQS